MEFQHELIIPNEGFPFKVFLFEGGNGEHDEAGTKKLIFMPISIGFSDKSWYADE